VQFVPLIGAQGWPAWRLLPSRFFSTVRALPADVMTRGRLADAGGLLSSGPSTRTDCARLLCGDATFTPGRCVRVGRSHGGGARRPGIAEYELTLAHVRARYDRPRRVDAREGAALEVHIFHSRQSVRMARTAIGLRSRQGGLRMAWNLLFSSIDHWAGITFVFRSALKPRERRMRKVHYLLQESRWSLCF
jgi:hypothetical protein